MSEFKKNNFSVVKQVLGKELTKFLYNYCMSKREVTKYLFKNRCLSVFDKDWGVFGDGQVKKCYAIYGDCVLDQLLPYLKKIIEKETEINLYENYSYMRVYEKNSELKYHRDRANCKFSSTLNLGGDQWPIYLKKDKHSKQTHKIILAPGDILIYDGTKQPHWREPLQGDHCVQVFLHYHDKNSPDAEKLKYDGRPMIGIVPWTRIHEVPTGEVD